MRYITEDFEKLSEFINGYNLNNMWKDDKLEPYLKKVHKKVLGYLVLYCETEKQCKTTSFFKEQSLLYFKESVSDIIQSVFTLVNGAYKASDLLMRSSIENFNKFVIGNTNENVYVEKSVYKIFDEAKSLKPYNVKIRKEYLYDVLHRIYGELCKSTHTATSDNMEHITAMIILPKYDESELKEYIKHLDLLIDSYLGMFLANYEKIICNMFRTNSEIFFEVLSKDVNRSVRNTL